jgi:hypothetical protein
MRSSRVRSDISACSNFAMAPRIRPTASPGRGRRGPHPGLQVRGERHELLERAAEAIDELTDAGTIGGPLANAADMQIFSSLRLLFAHDDLRPVIETWDCAATALRMLPDCPRPGPEALAPIRQRCRRTGSRAPATDPTRHPRTPSRAPTRANTGCLPRATLAVRTVARLAARRGDRRSCRR